MKKKYNNNNLKTEIIKPLAKVFMKNNILYFQPPVSIQDFASAIAKNTVEIIKYFFNKGKLIHININLSEDDIIELCLNFNIECEAMSKPVTHSKDELLFEHGDALETRAPIITIMGHVDHGKTTLLDYIHKTNITSNEAGGITQKIGAYQVEYAGKKITFIDTPGHEAFTKMRAKGARITDIAIIVVAADDGVKPQTKEAIDHAKLANLQIIVAINKIDKPNTNIDNVKQALSNLDLVPEEWGGKTIYVEISAKTGLNIDKLMDSILTLAEILELKSSFSGLAKGTIIESNLSKSTGPVITAIIQKGTLKIGDFIVADTTSGKVKSILDSSGKQIKSATVSDPVRILGLDNIPDTGIMFTVYPSKKSAEDIIKLNVANKKNIDLGQVNYNNLSNKEGVKNINLIIKTDSQGSIEAIDKSLMALNTGDVKLNILSIKTGVINNSDIDLAVASKSMLIGFNVRPASNTREYAKSKAMEIKLYDIIYKLIEDIETYMKGMMPKEEVEIVLGEAEVKEVFNITKVGNIAGCYVANGEIKINSLARVIRNQKTIFSSQICSIKHFKDDVNSVKKGNECGLVIKNFNDIKVSDIIETYEVKEVSKVA